MSIKSTLLFFVAVFIGLATSPAYAGDIISCDGFESCPAVPTDEILALEARIEALEALLAGATRGIDPGTSMDTLTFDNANSSEAVAIRKLSTTQGRGDFPVCFNGEGELLPCASNDPPPADDPYVGSWTGRVIYDRTSSGTCHDANVYLNVAHHLSDTFIESITQIRDTGGVAVWSMSPATSPRLTTGGFVSFDFEMFSIDRDATVTFNTQGSAQGFWNYKDGSCYGSWNFTKD
jgi:hypothetical protein